jgi:predicted aminopeptidase
LETLYDQELEAEVMRRRKQAVFSEMSAAYVRLKSNWQGYSGYDGWFAPPLNNAKIASLSTYNELVPLFLRLLDEKNGDLPSFYEACRGLAAMPMAKRRQRLQHYAPASTPERKHSTEAALQPSAPAASR